MKIELLGKASALITANLLLCANIAIAAPAPDVTEQQQKARQQETEQQQKARQQETEQQNRIELPSVMTDSGKMDEADNPWELPEEKDGMQVDTFVIDDGGKNFQWLKRELKPYEQQK